MKQFPSKALILLGKVSYMCVCVCVCVILVIMNEEL
jgi:hypothetical protein